MAQKQHKIDLMMAVLAYDLSVKDINISHLYNEVRKIEKAKLYYALKLHGEEVDGGYEYHYSENETPYVGALCWDDNEDVKVYAIRMTDMETLTLEVVPKSDPTCDPIQIGGDDVAYGHIDMLMI